MPAGADELDELRATAVELIIEAGNITLEHFRAPGLEVDTKADGSPVTKADLAAEHFLREELGRRFPDDAVVGEEFGESSGGSGRTWIIDPIDGTRAFTRGVPLFTNLLAMVDGGGPAVGVINAPAAGELVSAARSLGCTHNGTPCSVSQTSTLSAGLVTASGYDYWPPEHVVAVARTGAQMVTWGDGFGHILVATGRADAMVDPGLKHWDVAPLNVVIPEAGGTITNFAGQSLPNGGDVLASNGSVHSELLALLT